MSLKAEGISIIITLVVVCILLFLLGVYCHFCAEVNSGGHSFNDDDSPARVVYVGKSVNGGPKRNKCKCSNKFKGSCKKCEGEEFMGDDQMDNGQGPDFSDYSGDKGLDPGWGNKPDPIRSALGGGGGGNSGDNSGGGGGQDSSAMMMRDD